MSSPEALNGIKKLFDAKFPMVQNVKKDQIYWICERLTSIGINPNTKDVLYVRGFRGTPNVVEKHILTWKVSKNEKSVTTPLETKGEGADASLPDEESATPPQAQAETDEEATSRIRNESLSEGKPIIGLGILLDRISKLEKQVKVLTEQIQNNLSFEAKLKGSGFRIPKASSMPVSFQNGHLANDTAPSRKPLEVQNAGISSSENSFSEMTTLWVEIQKKIVELDLKPYEFRTRGETLGIQQVRWLLGSVEYVGRDYFHYLDNQSNAHPYLVVKRTRITGSAMGKGNLLFHRKGLNYIEGFDPSGNVVSPHEVREALKFVHSQLYPNGA